MIFDPALVTAKPPPPPPFSALLHDISAAWADIYWHIIMPLGIIVFVPTCVAAKFLPRNMTRWLKRLPAVQALQDSLFLTHDLSAPCLFTPILPQGERYSAILRLQIKYTEDYYDVDMNPEAEPTMPEWKVYFEGNFWGHSGKDHAGTEIRLNKQFDWARHHWVIPAAYSCSKGLVMDFCMRTPEEDIRKFITKWDLHPENDSCEYFTQEQQMQIDLDNPLCLDFIPRLELNGKTMLTSHGCSVVFNPCLPDGVINEAEAKWALEHYDLDTSYGWMIFRAAFPWTSKRRPEIKALSLTMEQQSCRVPGPHFKAHAPGDSFSFLHPVSGKKYTLTVQELEQQTISEKRYGSDRWFYPTHFTAMSYTLSPEPDSDVTICDCAEGDKPLEIAPCSDRYAPEARNDIACIGIIGGADGPIAIVCGDSSKEKLHAVCSSLHFEPVEGDIEWRIVFNIKSSNEMSLGLI